MTEKPLHRKLKIEQHKTRSEKSCAPEEWAVLRHMWHLLCSSSLRCNSFRHLYAFIILAKTDILNWRYGYDPRTQEESFQLF